jgi:hypothetical protein
MPDILTPLDAFRGCVTAPTWRRLRILIEGAILASGARTVTAILRATGRGQESNWSGFHRVLHTAPWSMLRASQILLGLLLSQFCPEGRAVFTLDDTLERRTGRRILLAGWFRDPVRSTEKATVTVRAVRWLVLALSVRPTWSDRHWSLPILCIPVPAPKEREEMGTDKHLIDFAHDCLTLIRRWCPDREIILVADGAFAVHSLYLRARARDVSIVTRCRDDLMLYDPLVPLAKRRRGRQPTHGPECPKLHRTAQNPGTIWTPHGQGYETHVVRAVWHRGRQKANPCPVACVLIRPAHQPDAVRFIATTDQTLSASEVVDLYEQRWGIEVTFQEARAHLGIETGRGWTENTIRRTTPALFALFSLVVYLAHHLVGTATIPLQQSAWYTKTHPTFHDLLAGVRRSLWRRRICPNSTPAPEVAQNSDPWVQSFLEIACYAA